MTVTERFKKDNDKRTYWKCLCECGNETIVWAANLRNGHTTSCGCKKDEGNKESIEKATTISAQKRTINLLGQKFGHLTVIQRDGSDARGEAKWLCECDCDNHSKVSVLSSNLRSGHTTSCGCERRSQGEIIVAKILTDNNIPFEQEVSLFKFPNGSNARFDFYVNNEYLIEYDGETHYRSNLHGWHNEDQLEAQLERDAIKDKWCKENNIPLIRIPYTIRDILTIDDLRLETSNYKI